jgi:cytochrome oxidase Cu insertion factor (SCO1/SenC/PrrC family)
MKSIGKWLATLVCVGLLSLVFTMSTNYHSIGAIRLDIPTAVGEVGGGKLPDFTLTDVNGHPVTLSSFYGKQRVVVTFDRSVDW